MNVFQDLVNELKEENLLEETVGSDNEEPSEESLSFSAFDSTAKLPTPGFLRPAPDAQGGSASKIPHESLAASDDGVFPGDDSSPESEGSSGCSELPESAEADGSFNDVPNADNRPASKRDREFFKKRVSGEVASLQMVEHIVAGIEREYLKKVPEQYDDFQVKKSLNIYLQSFNDADTERQLNAEFELLQETEKWCTALAARDKAIPTSSLRQFVQNSKPALSSQAMLALARFYRNLPYSEATRSKFDFIITRLFSKPIGGDLRACLFDRDEMLGHINGLYEEWSSVSLYAADEEEDSKILLTALSFADFADEAEKAETFDQLLKNEFFERLQLFKESISELFFAPNVVVAAIEANVRIGNVYVSLLEREQERLEEGSLNSKIRSFDQDAIAIAAARAFDQNGTGPRRKADGLKAEEMPDEKLYDEAIEQQTTEEPLPARDVVLPSASRNALRRLIDKGFSVNRWVLASCIAMIVVAIGIYVWGNYLVQEEVTSAGVTPISFQNSQIADHIKVAKLSGENLYLQMNASWDTLPKEKRQEHLQRLLQEGSAKGFKQVTIINSSGKYGGFASASRLDVVMP
jgi:hypothetical protein